VVPRNGFQMLKLTKSKTAGLINITNGVNVVVQFLLDTHGNDFDVMTLLPVNRG
jgi:hypothetical protein